MPGGLSVAHFQNSIASTSDCTVPGHRLKSLLCSIFKNLNSISKSVIHVVLMYQSLECCSQLDSAISSVSLMESQVRSWMSWSFMQLSLISRSHGGDLSVPMDLYHYCGSAWDPTPLIRSWSTEFGSYRQGNMGTEISYSGSTCPQHPQRNLVTISYLARITLSIGCHDAIKCSWVSKVPSNFWLIHWYT